MVGREGVNGGRRRDVREGDGGRGYILLLIRSLPPVV